MSSITVTAAEGVRVKATVQRLETLTRTVPAFLDASGTEISPARQESMDAWVPREIVAFASEAREFEVGAKVRVLIEEQA